MFSRRDFLRRAGEVVVASQVTPLRQLLPGGMVLGGMAETKVGAVRCINVINFLRGVEPRGPMDLFLPLQKQMEVSLRYGLPTTWLLQYDALVSGPFVEYLKAHMAKDHEVGIWFEMNEMHCKAAGVEWRGRPGFEWDHYPLVAFTIGYTPDERIKLADAFMSKFKEIWGRYPKSVASWNLDSITMAHLVERYGVDAFAVCRDQIATDGFTIWGAPIAGYYPSKSNCWSPALSRHEQIGAPVFRMLGQDPVYYFQRSFPFPDGKRAGGPITMEPVWPSGRSKTFIRNFLDMISTAPTLKFAYAQLGQENNFGWPEMEPAYALQMEELAALRKAGSVHVETMGESGRRFKQAFKETPAQAQVMLEDSFGNTAHPERTVWYQSRYYRANLHFKDDLPYLRDLTVYSDRNPQPFLHQPTRAHDVEQRMPAIVDGYHWSKDPGSSEAGAGGYFVVNGVRLRSAGKPEIHEKGGEMEILVPVTEGRTLHVRFEERKLSIWLTPAPDQALELAMEWDPKRTALVDVQATRALYRWQGFDYSVTVEGEFKRTEQGWTATRKHGPIVLLTAQPA